MDQTTTPDKSLGLEAAAAPSGLNHLVLNVRDIEAAHRFWTELVGFRHVGTLKRRGPNGEPPPVMRFYSGDHGGGTLRHHDIALMERPDLVPASGAPQGFNHVAISYPSEAAWRARVDSLKARGVPVHGRIDRGVTKSIHLMDPNGYEVELVWELPRDQWADDIDAALNRATPLTIDQ